MTALGDASPIVQGGAAEALGLIGDVTAADAVGRLASQIVQSGALARVAWRRCGRAAGPAGVGVPAGALRARQAEGVRPARRRRARCRRASRRCGGGRWPTRFQRIDDKRALAALLTLAKDPHPYTRAFAAKGLGGLKDASAVPTLLALLASGDRAVVDRERPRARPDRRSRPRPPRC